MTHGHDEHENSRHECRLRASGRPGVRHLAGGRQTFYIRNGKNPTARGFYKFAPHVLEHAISRFLCQRGSFLDVLLAKIVLIPFV